MTPILNSFFLLNAISLCALGTSGCGAEEQLLDTSDAGHPALVSTEATSDFSQVMMQTMTKMGADMMAAPISGNPDHDFCATMMAGPTSKPAADPNVNVQIVDALNKRYGAYPGYRSNHAKGIVVQGNFTPTPQAAQLSRSPLFAGAPLPVTVRFSDAGGVPDVHDAALTARPHGMSIKFHLPR